MLVISKVSVSVLKAAFEAADTCATTAGRSKGGWVRLAKVQGSAAAPYVIAIRPVSTERQYQFSCGCPDYLYRKSKVPGACCKHMQRFFQESTTTPGSFWFYKAGKAFVETTQALVRGRVEVPVPCHEESEAA